MPHYGERLRGEAEIERMGPIRLVTPAPVVPIKPIFVFSPIEKFCMLVVIGALSGVLVYVSMMLALH